MVRTRRSIEEEERVRIVRETGSDVYVTDPGLLSKLDGELLEDIYSFGGEQNKKALVVGCEDNGEIAVSLAKRGMFVVVVDDSKERLDRVIARSQEEKVFLKMTFFETDYMKKEFTGGSFDFVSLFSVLGRYNEPFTVIRKCKRELKIGGRILIRMKVKSLLQRLPGFMERIRVKINSLIFGDEAFGAVRDKIAAEFKIERVAVSRFSPPSHFASFFALKELELGKTFKI